MLASIFGIILFIIHSNIKKFLKVTGMIKWDCDTKRSGLNFEKYFSFLSANIAIKLQRYEETILFTMPQESCDY